MCIDVFDIVGIGWCFLEMKFSRDIFELERFMFYAFARYGNSRRETSNNTIDTVVLTYEFDIHRKRFFADEVIPSIRGYFLFKMKL